MVLVLIAAAVLAAEPQAVKPQVTVVVRGARPPTPEQVGTVELPIDLRIAEAPNAALAAPAPDATAQEQIAAARKSYINADFNKCLEQVADDSAMTNALADGDRTSAARVLLWRVACNVGAGKLEVARRAANQLAVFGLPVPAEVGSVSPEVEAVIAKGYQDASVAKPIPLAITGSEEGAEVQLDGRSTGCTTPCTLDVLEGSHVIRLTADGSTAAHRLVRVEAPRSEVKVALNAASPTLAAQQWTSRYAQSAEAEGSRSVRLLATALRTSRLVLLSVEEGPSPRTKALLAVDGHITARTEREGSLAELNGLLTDLLTRGNILEPTPPLYKRPIFWVAIVLAAGAAAGITAGVLVRDVKTSVVLK